MIHLGHIVEGKLLGKAIKEETEKNFLLLRRFLMKIKERVCQESQY